MLVKENLAVVEGIILPRPARMKKHGWAADTHKNRRQMEP